MTPAQVLLEIEKSGGSLRLDRDQIRYAIPKPAAWLVPEVRKQRGAIVALLGRRRPNPPPMPTGIRLLRWAPKAPPVLLQHCSVVIEVEKFIAATLAQLQARLRGNDFAAGNWSERELVDRLEQVGVEVEVERDLRSTKHDGAFNDAACRNKQGGDA